MNEIILLVEDNPRDAALTLRAFKKSNIANEVVVVGDGVEALDYLFGTGLYTDRDLSIMPQMVLLDLNMPKMGGFEVLERIRGDERTRRLPVVVFTSSPAEEDMINSYKLGVNSFVRKPVNQDEFIEATKHVGLYWLLVNEVPQVR